MITGKRKPAETLTKDQVKKKSVSHVTVTTTVKTVESRAALMKKAKEAGIKYYRILSKVELETVLAHPKLIPETIEAAKARWKAGFGKNKAVTQ
jgi:hypothetical protein